MERTMTIVTIHKAKTELSKLLARVEAGEEIIIARGNEPIARLVPVDAAQTQKPKRRPGSLSHLRGTIPPDLFLEPMSEEELSLWEGTHSFSGDNDQ
jgi:prevent-host-death family protein